MRNLYVTLHYLLVAGYVLAPIVAVWRSTRPWRSRRSSDLDPSAARTLNGGSGTLGAFVAGTVMGVSISVVYAVAVKGRVSIPQAIAAAYFATALLLLLRGFDGLLRSVIWRLSVRRSVEGGKPRVRKAVATLGNVLRVVVLFGVGLPFVMAAIVSYRPKVLPNDDPMTQMGFAFEPVRFEATDGVRIAGWWLPARGIASTEANRTVIVAHGLGSNKSNQLILARRLVPSGYNVLAIDLRAHGESGGQLTSFGDLERRDVLGAVRWLRQARPRQSERIYGVGASQGAAALIAAAASGTPEGDAIDALAVYGTYDDLDRLVRTLVDRTFLPPVNWLVERLALPIAAAHVGADLPNFRPSELVMRIWPRPILVIHGEQDQIIDFRHGQRLFHGATQPKRSLWIPRGDHNSIINSEFAAEAVREFFDNAQPVMVI